MGNTIAIDETRTMIEAVRDIPPLPTFLKRTFFGMENKAFLTERVMFDVMNGKRRMAPFVAPRVGGIPMLRDGFSTQEFMAPKIAPERVISPDEINKRGLGEDVFSAKTPAQRAVEMEAEDYTFLDESISLREEWMCRQCLFEGAIDISGEANSGNPVEFHVDYRFENDVALSGSDLWTDPAAQPMEQFVKWRREIVAESGLAPDILLMRSETAMMLIGHPNFKALYDTLRYNFGSIEPAIKEPMLTFFGRLPIVGADIYAYDATFIDPATGDAEFFIPENKVLFAASRGNGKMVYGAISYMVADGKFATVALPRVPMVFFDQDASTRTLRMVSRPLPMPVNVKGWAVRRVA